MKGRSPSLCDSEDRKNHAFPKARSSGQPGHLHLFVDCLQLASAQASKERFYVSILKKSNARSIASPTLLLSHGSASSLRDSKLTMIDSKSINENASSASGRNQNLLLAEGGLSGRRFFSCSPRPLPVALTLAPGRSLRSSKMAPAIANSAFFGFFSAIKTPIHRLQAG